MTKLLRFILVVVISVTTCWAQQTQRYDNPVIRGDRPDPSVIRVGDTYWATVTSGMWEPGFPIFKSSDLLNWEIAGAVFLTPPVWSIGSFWAPEITTHRGRFFVYYTARRTDGRLCVAVATASVASGPYTDHGPLVCQEVGSIDAMAVTDDRTGARYLVWKEDGNSRCKDIHTREGCQLTRNWVQRLSENGLELLGKAEELIRNDPKTWEGHVVEGAFILRRNNWFYLFYSGNACCRSECNYALGVARSKNLLGPYEKHSNNPILRGNDKWKCPGHGSIVTDTQGRDFLLYHAYRNLKSAIFIGREALLDQISWGADGWPKINDGGGPSGQTLVGDPPAGSLSDGFDGPNLKPTWEWPAFQRPSIKMDTDGWLMMSPPGDHAHDKLGGVLAQPVTTGSFVATTLIETSLMKDESVAGLSAYQYRGRAVGVAVGGGAVSTYIRDDNKHQITPCENDVRTSRIYLRMTVTNGSSFRFAFSLDGENWKNCGNEIHAGNLAETRIALTVGGESGGAARFDWLRVTPL